MGWIPAYQGWISIKVKAIIYSTLLHEDELTGLAVRLKKLLCNFVVWYKLGFLCFLNVSNVGFYKTNYSILSFVTMLCSGLCAKTT